MIQRADQPIILTGFQALNKLLGRPVYSSQMQLGGPRVMACNGVSHLVVQDDLQGAKAILEWLAFVPLAVGGEHTVHDVSVLSGSDAVSRPVTYAPPPGQRFKLRDAVTGCNVDGEWAAGLFDRGSWREYQAGWAQTVITGRARLEGHPVAVLGVESQTVTVSVPADPGMPSSSEQQLSQAGQVRASQLSSDTLRACGHTRDAHCTEPLCQSPATLSPTRHVFQAWMAAQYVLHEQVWYPDSAQKTADALQEYDREGLPLVILANWRGFSGGKRDLFEGVLQAGAGIVENLRRYRWPVTVYMPPGCDLRGGAWVVIDSQINHSMVEMYAGVLAPRFEERSYSFSNATGSTVEFCSLGLGDSCSMLYSGVRTPAAALGRLCYRVMQGILRSVIARSAGVCDSRCKYRRLVVAGCGADNSW